MMARIMPGWVSEAWAGMSYALCGDGDQIQAEVDSGAAKLWNIPDCDGWMVTRLDSSGELVIVAYQGRDAAKIAPHIIAAARANGVKSIRFHARNPAVGRLLRPAGFKLREYVFGMVV